MQTLPIRSPCSIIGIAALLSIAFLTREAAAAPTGEQIYRKHCANCHGQSGEGAKAYPHPLVGDRSLPQLVKQIAKTMPEDKPGSLNREETEAVSAFVFDSFYSKSAQERNKAPRIELSRLTVAQYRNAVADLIGSFRGPVKLDDKHGLRGEYFNSRGFQNNKRAIDRVDPQVQFDFGTAVPPMGKFDDPHQFSIRWEGAARAPETGDYEFIVRTEHAVRLWVNDNKNPLIDAWVKSGSDTEYRGSIFLLAGRAYPLRLEFSKAKQGVDDSKKNKDRPVAKASMALLWKLPKRAEEVIPARDLLPGRPPETFVATTPFPPDDRSLGWERGTTVSKAWDQATTDAALETAAYVIAHLNELSGAREGAADRDAKLREFCGKFVERAFRRPLSDAQKQFFVDHQFENAKEPELALKRVVLLALKSPRFLYREAENAADAYDSACRLSFALWDAPPDPELLKAAADGQLKTREQLLKQAERMLGDPRARTKLRQFLLTWLKVDRPAELAKDAKRFPGFDAAIASDLRTSLELFLDEILESGASDFRQLMLSETLPLNGRLAKFYGVDLPPDAGFQKVKLNGEHRAGVLSHPYLMATFAYTGTSSPIHRGVFLARGILGVSLRPPQDAFTPLAEDLHPKLTTRERVALQTRPAACVSCHGIINSLGFTLEHFDAVGRYREKENEKPIDSKGSYLTRHGETVNFTGIRDLAKFLAASEEVHNAFTEQMFHHLVKQPARAYGPGRLAQLRESFARYGFSIRKLAAEIAVTSALPDGETILNWEW